jgi:putative endonuclease
MAQHLDTGRAGEQLAVEFLAGKGWQILERNWRAGHRELDIIASHGSILHFVEVKTKHGRLFGNPEDQVGRGKMRYLASAAEQYLYLHPQWKRIQFNIIAITLLNNGAPEILLIEDVFY